MMYWGSPPQVRGILRIDGSTFTTDGITPAGAGHTQCHGSHLCCSRDHPRRCGAYDTDGEVQMMYWGSPPQVRGIRSLMYCHTSRSGITPAGAGHTHLFRTSSQRLWDHPRRCGAYTIFSFVPCERKGSPPQVRGILLCEIYRPQIAGITPAGAGHTQKSAYGLPAVGDHPRRCGAY